LRHPGISGTDARYEDDLHHETRFVKISSRPLDEQHRTRSSIRRQRKEQASADAKGVEPNGKR